MSADTGRIVEFTHIGLHTDVEPLRILHCPGRHHFAAEVAEHAARYLSTSSSQITVTGHPDTPTGVLHIGESPAGSFTVRLPEAD